MYFLNSAGRIREDAPGFFHYATIVNGCSGMEWSDGLGDGPNEGTEPEEGF